ncbi:MAG: hypothetical protein ACLFQ3_09665, partial [Thiohalorhabdus sp.]
LVTFGQEEGVAEIVADDSGERFARVVWPDCKLYSEGAPIEASPYAAGLVSVADLDSKERADVLMEYLRARPFQGDLFQWFGKPAPEDREEDGDPNPEVPDADLERAWHAVTVKDWDDAAKAIGREATELKGQWQGLTGRQRYGSKIGASWTPEAWTEDLRQATEEQLQEAQRQAEAEFERAVGAEAVDEERLAQLRELAATADERQREYEEAQKAEDEARKKVEAVEAQLAELPEPELAPQACPHCGGELQVDSDHRIHAADGSSEEERQRIQQQWDNVHARLEENRTAHQEAYQAMQQAQDRATEASNAVLELDQVKQAQGDGSRTERARAARDHAADRLEAFRAYHKARHLHERIQVLEAIKEALGPDGVRKKRLQDALAELNEILDLISEQARWPARVWLDAELRPQYGQTSYQLLSESEKYRVRITLQLALAWYEDAAAVVIDGADILGRSGRNGLLRALVGWWQRPALVAMTVDRKEDAPDLAAKGVGCTYWTGAEQ